MVLLIGDDSDKTGNRFTFGMYLLITVSVMAKTKLSNFSSSYSNLLPKTIEHMALATALLIRPQKYIDEHNATLNEDDVRDFIDAYLLEIKHHKHEKNTLFTGK
jgi:hypothetical protein